MENPSSPSTNPVTAAAQEEIGAIIHIGAAVAATVVLLISGLMAGLIPAWRAMQIKAIDAIREE